MEFPGEQIFQCDICKITFKWGSELERHKRRKKPCFALSNELPQCEFCGKIFPNDTNLGRHVKTCKAKIDDDNDDNEDLREHMKKILIITKQCATEIQKLKKENEEFRRRLDELSSPSRLLVQNMAQNAHQVNNYLDPSQEFTLTQDDFLTVTPMRKLIEMVYFSENLPMNHSIFAIDVTCILIYNDEWVAFNGATLELVVENIKKVVRNIVLDKLQNGKIIKHKYFYPTVKDKLSDICKHQDCEGEICTTEYIMKVIIDNNKIVERDLIKNGIKYKKMLR